MRCTSAASAQAARLHARRRAILLFTRALLLRARCAEYGAESNDRVHKSFFYGSKHIDQYVPKVNGNPRMDLTQAKQAQWAQQLPPTAPTKANMYETTALASSMAYAGVKSTVPP